MQFISKYIQTVKSKFQYKMNLKISSHNRYTKITCSQEHKKKMNSIRREKRKFACRNGWGAGGGGGIKTDLEQVCNMNM